MRTATALVLAAWIAAPAPQQDLDSAYAEQALKLAEECFKANDHDAARFLAGLAGSKAPSAKERADALIESIKSSTAKAVSARESDLAIVALAKRWAGEWRKVAKNAGAEAPRLLVEAEIFDALLDHAKALALFNRRRSAAGIGKVDYDFALSYGCQLHAKYLALHPDEENPHSEKEGAAGYSEAGKKAAENSVVGWGETFLVHIEGQLGTLYHRTSLINPDTTKTGFGNSSGKSGKVTVIDTLSALSSSDSLPRWVAYPPKGAVDVFLQMEPESSGPVPKDVEDKVGYPITVSFFADEDKVTEVTATVKGAGVAIDCFVSTPEKPAVKTKDHNKGIIGLIPKKPLAARTEYSVSIKCKYRDETLKIEWSFKTGTALRP